LQLGGLILAIAVVTDSTADLGQEQAREKGITVVPLTVSFGTDSYQDGEDITADKFYELLTSSDVFPTTSQPSVGAFAEVYRLLSESHDAIISLHISAKVSGTYASAIQAKSEIGDVGCQIEVIDTLQASMSLGLITLGVADSVLSGASLKEATDLAENMAGRASVYAMMETLEYLHRGGRIGKAQFLLGSLLKTCPILTFADGVVEPVDRPRTRERGIRRLVEIVQNRAPLTSVSVLSSTDEEGALDLASRLADIAPTAGSITARIGPTLGAHVGPGALGVAFISEESP